MSQRVIVSISCVSQSELLTAVARRLFELGCNLADTTFAVLSGSAEFTTVCELPAGLAEESLALELHRMPMLAGAKVIVSPFDPVASEARSQRITHRFEFSGPDRSGKILRLSEAFAERGAVVVRLNSQWTRVAGEARSTIRIAVSLPDGAGEADFAALAGTARALDLDCRVETVQGGDVVPNGPV